MSISLPPPDLQIEFASALEKIRALHLQDALLETMSSLDIRKVDEELAEHVSGHSLATLAAHGLRGELVFPVPIVLQANPRLIGYYRLLYGYSQKEFYNGRIKLGRFVGMENRGEISAKIAKEIPDLATAFCDAGSILVAAFGAKRISAGLLDDLTLLTLGTQLRGGANVRKGIAGIRTVFNAIHDIVQGSAAFVSETKIEIRNSSGRLVLIEFAPDPDIIIREEMREGSFRQIVAIEVKAGEDFSNIHNRIGEAEKSHQKAKADGYPECWTVVNVNNIDIDMARKESPTTNHFYRISDLISETGDAYQDFRDRVMGAAGISH